MHLSMLCVRTNTARAVVSLIASVTLAAQEGQAPAQPAPSAPLNHATGTRPPLRDDLAALAKRLAKGHNLAADAPETRGFHADVRLEQHQGQAVTVDVTVDFQLPRALRCKVHEKGVRVERGFDPRLGAWSISGGELVKLQGPEHNLEVEMNVARDLRLCAQLIKFLNPDRFLASLQEPGAVRQEDLKIKREAFAGCPTVDGIVDNVPAYTIESKEGQTRSRVQLFLHPESSRLLAVHLTPLDADGKPQQLTEMIVLQEYAESQGVWLPTKMNVYRCAGPGLELLWTVWIGGIDLRKQFAPDHFARPKDGKGG